MHAPLRRTEERQETQLLLYPFLLSFNLGCKKIQYHTTATAASRHARAQDHGDKSLVFFFPIFFFFHFLSFSRTCWKGKTSVHRRRRNARKTRVNSGRQTSQASEMQMKSFE